MDSEVVQRATARSAPGIVVTNPDNTFEDFVWPDGVTSPTSAAVDVVLVRRVNAVPPSATRGRLIRAIHHVGKLTEVRDAVTEAAVLMQKLWLSPTFQRNDPLLLSVAEVVGLTEHLDDLFRLSATLYDDRDLRKHPAAGAWRANHYGPDRALKHEDDGIAGRRNL